MKTVVIRILNAFGLDIRKTVQALREIPYFVRTLSSYRRQAKHSDFPLAYRHLYPLLTDRAASAGDARGHYFFQDLWAARKIVARKPAEHIDVGSRIDGFIAHLLPFMPVAQLDIRPLKSSVEGLSFIQGNATTMESFADNSVVSLSSLHVVEHFGLGRYGDPVDPDAWKCALHAFSRVLQPDGRLYLSTPVGRQRVEFNGERVFSPSTILAECRGLRLLSFSAVLDDGTFVEGLDPEATSSETYACGMFEFTK